MVRECPGTTRLWVSLLLLSSPSFIIIADDPIIFICLWSMAVHVHLRPLSVREMERKVFFSQTQLELRLRLGCVVIELGSSYHWPDFYLTININFY